MTWPYKLLARGGKLLTTGGKAVVMTDANRAALEDCCCGGCDTPECCVNVADLPATIKIKYEPDASVPASIRPAAAITITAAHLSACEYRGSVVYAAADGTQKKAWYARTSPACLIIGDDPNNDNPYNTAGSAYVLAGYFNDCDDGQCRIYNDVKTLPAGPWGGTTCGTATFDSGDACCPCKCKYIDISGPWGTIRLTDRTIIDPWDEWTPCTDWDLDDGSGSQGMCSLNSLGYGYMDYWPGDGHSYESHFAVCCIDGVLRIKCLTLYIDYEPQDCDQYEYGISASSDCCDVFADTQGCEEF